MTSSVARERVENSRFLLLLAQVLYSTVVFSGQDVIVTTSNPEYQLPIAWLEAPKCYRS